MSYVEEMDTSAPILRNHMVGMKEILPVHHVTVKGKYLTYHYSLIQTTHRKTMIGYVNVEIGTVNVGSTVIVQVVHVLSNTVKTTYNASWD